MFRYGFVLKDKPFIKQVFMIAIPMMLQQLLTTSVNLLDNLMVGQLGDIAIAAVATSNKFLIIGTFAMIGIVNTATIYLAQFYGANDKNNMQQAFRYSIVMSVVMIFPFVLAGLFFSKQVIAFFNNDPLLIEVALRYMPVVSISFIFQALSFALQNSLRSTGYTKPPLYAAFFSLILNAFFNYALIFGHFGFPKLGVLGAAIGTLIARMGELLFISYIYHCNDYPFKSNFADLCKIRPSVIKTITIKSIPLVLNEVLWSSGMAFLYKLYGTRGVEVMSAYTVSQTIGDLFYILFSGMAAATTVLVAHPLGANDLEKARRHGYQLLQLAMLMALVFAGGMFLSSYLIPLLYQVSPIVEKTAQNLLRISSYMFSIYMFNSQCYFIIRSGGDMKSTLLMDALYMWSVNLTTVGFFTYFTDVNIYQLFMIGQATDLFKLLLTYHMLKKEKWVKNLTQTQF